MGSSLSSTSVTTRSVILLQREMVLTEIDNQLQERHEQIIKTQRSGLVLLDRLYIVDNENVKPGCQFGRIPTIQQQLIS